MRARGRGPTRAASTAQASSTSLATAPSLAAAAVGLHEGEEASVRREDADVAAIAAIATIASIATSTASTTGRAGVGVGPRGACLSVAAAATFASTPAIASAAVELQAPAAHPEIVVRGACDHL